MQTLPATPIEKAVISFLGDNSVGIHSATFNLEMYLDIGIYTEKRGKEIMEGVRLEISNLYELINGDAPDYVLFDFEVRERDRAEKSFDDTQNEIDEGKARYDAEKLVEDMQDFITQEDMRHVRPSKVKCFKCNQEHDASKVEFLDIFSDFEGRDNMKFVCPTCQRQQSSIIYL